MSGSLGAPEPWIILIFGRPAFGLGDIPHLNGANYGFKPAARAPDIEHLRPMDTTTGRDDLFALSRWTRLLRSRAADEPFG